MVVSILILEEALWVKSFSINEEFEFLNNVLDIYLISLVWILLTVE